MREVTDSIRVAGRPMRTCYLISASDAQAKLDAIFAESYARWGGVFTPIVPMRDGAIDPHYFAWIKYLDPDIVYCYGDVAKDTLRDIDDAIMPALVMRHNETHGRFAPFYQPDPLGSLSVIPSLSRQRSFLVPHLTSLVDADPSSKANSFVLDSFGIRSASHGQSMMWPMDPQLSGLINTVELVGSQPRQGSHHSAIEVATSSDLLSRMRSDRGIGTMANLASAFVDGLRARHPWGFTFNIFVGDSAMDRIAFWNSRLHAPAQALKQAAALRLTAAQASDGAFVDEMTHFVHTANTYVSGGSGSIAIRSSSVDTAVLEQMRDRMLAIRHAHISIEMIKSEMDCLPAQDALLDEIGNRSFLYSAEPVAGEKTRVTAEIPLHLVDALSITSQQSGYWASDINVPRPRVEADSPFTHQDVWMVPRRQSALHLISREAECRVNGRFGITVFSSHAKREHIINTPGRGSSLVGSLFRSMPYGLTIDLRAKQLGESPAYYAMRVSHPGRLLYGALDLFGSLFNAYEAIANRYWRTVFLRMAAPSALASSETHEEMKSLLRADWKRSGRSTLSSDADWDVISASAVKHANHVNAPIPIATMQTLRAWRLKDAEDSEIDIDKVYGSREAFDRDFVAGVTRMCQRGVLIQGYQWLCVQCGHRNWRTMSALEPSSQCEICRYEKHLEADFGWSFLLNHFLAEGFRAYDLMSLIWGLGALNMHTLSSYGYSPSLELFLTPAAWNDRKPDAEVDIACIMDGKFAVGEIKASQRFVKEQQFQNVVAVAQHVKADVLILGCMDATAEVKLKRQEEIARKKLADVGCVVKTIHPSRDFYSYQNRID